MLEEAFEEVQVRYLGCKLIEYDVDNAHLLICLEDMRREKV